MHCAVQQTSSLRILIGDDQPDVLEALRLLFKGAGHRTVAVDSPASLLRASQAESFDLILMDLNYARDTTSGQEGLDLLNRLQSARNSVPIVVMTAWGNIDLAVEAMRRGASDFVQKPWDNRRLLETVDKQSRTRQTSEIDLARHVQRKLFPQQPVASARFTCVANCLPARDVSGDYYDFIEMQNGITGIVLADVSGKGMAAALLMANLQASFRSQSALAMDNPLKLLESVNSLFHKSTPPEHYATLFYAQYDERTRWLRYVNCGHPQPMLIRADGCVERLDSAGQVLGLFPTWTGQMQTAQLHPGDTAAFFSDGISEAGIESEREYGEERLMSLLTSNNKRDPVAMMHSVLDSVEAFTGGRQEDDRTLILLRAQA